MERANYQPGSSRSALGPMRFVMKLRADGRWQWRLFDNRGELVANCVRPYQHKSECLDAVLELKQFCAGAIIQEL